jgi:hypothetical protein
MRLFLIFATCMAVLVPTQFLCAAEAEPAAVFSGAQGNYGGRIEGGSSFLDAGALVIVLEATGRFSANLNWQGYRYPFLGKFDAGTATFNRQFNNRSEEDSVLILSLTLNPSGRTIDCTLDVATNGSTTISANGQLSGAAPDGTAGQAYQGTTNTSFIDPPGYGSTPQDIDGDGFSISRISRAKSHAIRVIGRLPDTTAFAGGSLLRGSTYTIFSALYRSKHGIGGNAHGSVDASDTSSLASTLLWAKRAGADPKYYPAGFDTGVSLITSGYKSVAVRAIPHISVDPGPISATLTLKDGNLPADLTAQIKITFFGVRVFAPNPQHIILHTSAAAANWAGSFIHPVSGQRTKFHGGFTEAHGNTNGEGRGNFRGSVATNSVDLPESGSARIVVNP